MAMSDSDAALFGIAARMRGRVEATPQVRWAADGSELLEFSLQIADDWPPGGPVAQEVATVRFFGQQPELMRWLAHGRHVVCQGTLHLARWTGKGDGVPRARLLLEATYVQPLNEERPDPKRAAVYGPRPPQPTTQPPSETERLDRLQAIAESTTVELKQAPKSKPKSKRGTIVPLSSKSTGNVVRRSTEELLEPKPTQADLSRRYEEIYGKEGA